jgi:hypothetical protein
MNIFSLFYKIIKTILNIFSKELNIKISIIIHEFQRIIQDKGEKW